jgi:hypothetical protein
MSKVDQLLAKALSTSSEDEAIACLRMARKQPGVEKTTTKQTDTNIDWYAKAEQYYKLSRDLQHRLNSSRRAHEQTYKQMDEFNSMYYRAYNECQKLRGEMRNLKSWYKSRDSVIGVILSVAIMAGLLVIL